MNHTITIAILLFAIFSMTGCVEQKVASSTEAKISREKSINPQITAAQSMIDKAPEKSDGYSLLALAYIRSARESGDFSFNSKAETSLKRALEIDPENVIAQKLNASLHLTFHRFPEALELATKLQQKYPQDAFLYGVLTDANVELGNYDEAAKNVQKMVDLKPNMESYTRVSHIRSLYGDTDGAIAAMVTATNSTDPKDKEALAWCRVHVGNEYFKAGKFKEAEMAYDLALTGFPEYHFALTGKGQARMAVGDFENAIKFLQKSQDRVPLTETEIALGNLYQKIGNAEKANEQYKLVEIIEQKLGVNNDQRALVLLWADRDEKLDEALEIAAKEYSFRKDVYTADVYAWCLYKKGNFTEAQKIIQEALRIKNKDARIFYHAGMIAKALNNKKEAARFLKLALETNSAFDLLQAEKAKLALAELN